MLGRRILRIKVFKAVYTLAENPSLPLKELQHQFDASCEATRDLYLFMLMLPQALVEEAAGRIEAARSKFNPTEEERNPNLKFVRNGIAAKLASDPDFEKICTKKKLSWSQYDVLLRHLYDTLRSRPYYQSYMSNPEQSLAEDAALFVKFYENELVDNPELEEILEDLSIWWNDDLAYALTWDCKTVESIAKGTPWQLPELYQSDMKKGPGVDDDRVFVRRILAKAVANFETYASRIAARTPKWDGSRICATDLALIVCGLAEMDAFPQTAPNIVINEYVEISKYYSTAESRAFVNGILDNIIKK